MERSLALSVPLTKAVVAAAVGAAAYRFIDDTQNVRAAAISWMLPKESKQAGKLAAVELLTVYVMVMVGRVVVDGVRRERAEMFRRVAALAVTLLALDRDVFVVAIACSLITELRDATVHFRTFARTASGFPHYETVAYAASQRLAVVAFYVFQAIPTLYAIYALSAHIRAGTLPPKSPLGAIAITATTASAIRAVRASVADAQLAVADRVIRRRILDVSTSAEI